MLIINKNGIHSLRAPCIFEPFLDFAYGYVDVYVLGLLMISLWDNEIERILNEKMGRTKFSVCETCLLFLSVIYCSLYKKNLHWSIKKV